MTSLHKRNSASFHEEHGRTKSPTNKNERRNLCAASTLTVHTSVTVTLWNMSVQDSKPWLRSHVREKLKNFLTTWNSSRCNKISSNYAREYWYSDTPLKLAFRHVFFLFWIDKLTGFPPWNVTHISPRSFLTFFFLRLCSVKSLCVHRFYGMVKMIWLKVLSYRLSKVGQLVSPSFPHNSIEILRFSMFSSSVMFPISTVISEFSLYPQRRKFLIFLCFNVTLILVRLFLRSN